MKESELAKPKIRIKYEPLAVRNDCSSIGQWKVGANHFIGKRLSFSILGIGRFHGKLGMSRANWLEIFFITAPDDETEIPKNVVCVTYFKTESAANLITSLIMAEEAPEGMIWKGEMITKQNEKGRYSVLEITGKPRETAAEKEQLNLMAEFLAGKPTLSNANLPRTMIKFDSEESLNLAIETVDFMLAVEEEENGAAGKTAPGKTGGLAKTN